MRWVLFVPVLVACSSSDPVNEDVGALERFHWSAAGTGVGSSFTIDRDCGVETTFTQQNLDGGPPIVKRANGAVPLGECESFERTVTARQFVDAIRPTTSLSCPGGPTDDQNSFSLNLVDGKRFARTTSSCSGTEPFAAVMREASRLGQTYAKNPADAGGP